MRLLQNIFAFFWALWGLVAFLLVIVIPTPIYAIVLFIGGKKYVPLFIWINMHYLSAIVLWLYGIRVKVIGKELIAKDKAYVFVANHAAGVDVMATGVAMTQPAFFLAKNEARYIPVFGFMVRMLSILVDRKSKESREKAMQYMLKTLREGYSLFLYPEGTRNRTSALLKEFKDGAFRTAIAAQVPIAVQTLLNTKGVNNPNGIHLLPGKVTVVWNEPIETKGMTEADIPTLSERVRNIMLENLQTHSS